MATLQPTELGDQKPEIYAVDDNVAELKQETGVGLAAYESDGILKSRFDELSLFRTLWVFRRSVLYCFAVYTLGMIEGWELGVSGSVIANKGFINAFGNGMTGTVADLDTSWVSAWGASINLGQFVAIGICPWLANRWGRKVTFYLCWIMYVLGLVVLTVARSPGLWFFGKLLSGIACGIQQLTTTPYVVEICPNRVRGGIGTSLSAWSSVGGIICNLMLQVANKRYPTNWLIPIYVIWGMSAIMAACIIILPESPWYFARRGDKEKCMHSLKRLYGNIKGYDFDEEYNIILRTLVHERAVLEVNNAASWRDLFTGLNLRRSAIVAIYEVGSLLVGLAMVSTYSTYFFSLAGQSDPFLASLIVSCIQLASILGYAFIIDKVGRRIPVNIAYSTACLVCWLMGVLYYIPGKGSKNALLALTCIWSACFVISSNTYWLFAAELPSAHLRMKTGSFGLFCGACFGIITCFAVPPMLTNLNIRSGFIFGATSLPISVFMWFFLPETKGRAAAEIDELFERKIPAWKWAKTKTVVEEQMMSAAASRRGEIGV